MMTRDDKKKIENLKIAQNCTKTVEYDILRYSTSFGKGSDQSAEFKGHFMEFPKIGTR